MKVYQIAVKIDYFNYNLAPNLFVGPNEQFCSYLQILMFSFSLQPPCDITTLVRHDRCVTMSMTSHDADSGRGDSDPDVPASDVTQDYGTVAQ